MASRKTKSKAKSTKIERVKPKPKTKSKPRKKSLPSRTTRSNAFDPSRFQSLADLRRAIDTMDDILVPLLCRRLSLVASAARFKPSVAGVVVLSRVEEIIVRVRAQAEKLGSSPDCLEALYRSLIDLFTAEEQRNWKKLHGAG